MSAQLLAGVLLLAGSVVLMTCGAGVVLTGRRSGAAASYLQSASPVIRIHAGFISRKGPRSLSVLSLLGERITPAGRRAKLAALAERAGDPSLSDTAMSAKVLMLFFAAGLFWLASPILGMAGIAAAWFGPQLWLASRAEGRATAIRRSLPDLLDLLAISVEAGAGLDAAMARAASEVGGPVGEEFGRLLHSLNLGSSRREAFIALKDRVQVRELSAFVLALLQAEALGISLASVLRTQATEMRAVRRRLAREQAAKAPVKILFPLVFGIFPALMLVVLGPAAIRIMQTLGAG